jgi:hypothetical protein
MAAADLKELKYPVNSEDLIPPSQDVTMLGTDQLVFIFSNNELGAYDLKTLIKIAGLLGIRIEAGDSRTVLIDKIRKFLLKFPGQYLNKTPRDIPDSAGLILRREYDGNTMVLTLFDRGLEIAFQNWIKGMLIHNARNTEYLDILRTYTYCGPDEGFLSRESRHFWMTDTYLSWDIQISWGKYYIVYKSRNNIISKQRYETELAQELSKLEAISQVAKQTITQASIPLGNIIEGYLGTKINQ